MGKPDPINCRRSDLVGLRRILLTYKLCSQKRYLCTYCSNGPKLFLGFSGYATYNWLRLIPFSIEVGPSKNVRHLTTCLTIFNGATSVRWCVGVE